ncbi:MAG: hypothetical protein L0H31_02965 [Nocardioidaceae bacterium]|nr:hypothetical protein [Nocardioidaceae bacterium]
MDRDRLIDELPASLAVALRLRDAGHDDQTIADALGVPVESVQVSLRVAQLKLDELANQTHAPTTGEGA